MRRLKVRAFPTFILMDAEGREIERWAGFGKAKYFIAELQKAAADPTPLGEKIARFEMTPDAGLARRIGQSLAYQNKPLEALRFIEAAGKLDPKLEKEMLAERLYQTNRAVDSGQLPFEALKSAVDDFLAPNPAEKYGLRMAARMLSEAFPEEGDRKQLTPYLERALATFKKKPRREWEADQKKYLESALAGPVTIERQMAEFEKKPDSGAALDLAREMYWQELYTEALKMFRRAVELDPKNVDKAWLLGSSAMAVREEGLDAGELKREVAGYLERNKDDKDAPLEAARYLSLGLGRGQDNALLKQHLEAALALLENPADEEKKSLRTDLLIRQALTLEGDKEKAIALKREMLGEGWEEDPAQVIEYSSFLLRNQVDLGEAESYARKGIDMSDPGWERAQACAALARALQAQGKKAEAVEALEQALKNSPRSKTIKAHLARLREG